MVVVVDVAVVVVGTNAGVVAGFDVPEQAARNKHPASKRTPCMSSAYERDRVRQEAR